MVIGFFGFPLYSRFVKLVTANFPTAHNEVRRITDNGTFPKSKRVIFFFFCIWENNVPLTVETIGSNVWEENNVHVNFFGFLEQGKIPKTSPFRLYIGVL